MARKSKVTGISVEYHFLPKDRICGKDEHGIMFAHIHFHRSKVPTNHSYRIKYYSDRTRIRKILQIADHVYVSPGPYGALIQGHYDYGFLDNKWVVYFLKYFSWLYWSTLWLMMLYLIYTKYF